MIEKPPPKKEKILLVVGDGAFGEQLARELRSEGYVETSLVTDGEQGMKAIYDQLPHLVILDVSLPSRDGYEILTQKQAEPLLANIPVFLIATQGVPINMRNVPAGSVAEFVMGIHIDPKEILSKVNRHFSYNAGPGDIVGSDPDANSTKKKLLWVEDDKLIGTILAKKLINSGFNLFHVKDGEDALAILKKMRPDVIVVDLILPGMSGFDILQRFGDDERLKNVPKIVLSNLSKPSDVEKARSFGAQKFLVKAATSLDQIVAEVKAVC